MSKHLPPTEKNYNIKKSIDKLDLNSSLNVMVNDNNFIITALKESIDDIEAAIEKIYQKLNDNYQSRLIYVGAGTSGRIGVQDGVELYPTFGWPKKRVGFVIAGGKNALLESIEGVEDDITKAKIDSKKIKINKNDVLLALAASGNTPFTNEVISIAKDLNALTIAISNNPNGIILEKADYKILLNTGPEVLTGSTRLKAGTAQKICLNMISTLVMGKLGRIKDGQMTHLVTTNKKLIERKIRIEKRLKNKKNYKN